MMITNSASSTIGTRKNYTHAVRMMVAIMLAFFIALTLHSVPAYADSGADQKVATAIVQYVSIMNGHFNGKYPFHKVVRRILLLMVSAGYPKICREKIMLPYPMKSTTFF